MTLKNITALALVALLGSTISSHSSQNNQDNNPPPPSYQPKSLEELAQEHIARHLDAGSYTVEEMGDVPEHLMEGISNKRRKDCPSAEEFGAYLTNNDIGNRPYMNYNGVHFGKFELDPIVISAGLLAPSQAITNMENVELLACIVGEPYNGGPAGGNHNYQNIEAIYRVTLKEAPVPNPALKTVEVKLSGFRDLGEG